MKVYAQKQPRQQANDIARVRANALAAHLPAHSIIHLQRTNGHQAVRRLVDGNAEILEAASPSATPRFTHDFSRIPAYSKAPARLDTKPAANAQRNIHEEADRVVQRRALPSGRRFPDKTFIHEQAARGIVGSARQLPHLDAIQRSFGRHSVEGVRAHVGGAAARASEAIGAFAYTVGDDIAFRQTPDLHTAAHEAAHVVQQRGSLRLDGGVGDAGDRYEQDAEYVANEVVWGRTSEALLDAYERGAVQSPAVQRLDQPIVTTAPKGAISIRDFIKLVEAEEAKWPAAEQTNTSLMITRLRKIFYGLPGWDKYLIPGAKGIASGYNISEEETGRENLSLWGPDADIVRSHQVVKDSSGASPAIASQQEVRLEDGTFDDIGHVFAGLDAAHYATSVSAPLDIASVADNKAAVTWTGDLGSAVSEISFKASNAGVPAAVTSMQAIVNEYASAQDMVGDIDAYVIAGQYNISNSGGKKVSELLRAYYLGAASSADGRAREHRYSRFCALTGLTGWTGRDFANEAAWLDRWTPEVAGAAALYYGATTSGALAAPGRAGSISAIQDPKNPIARLLLRNFLAALKTRVAAEPP
jgi:hypothetical protein